VAHPVPLTGSGVEKFGKELQVAQKFEDLNEDEQRTKFEEWKASRAARKIKSGVKNTARRQVLKAHKPEYDKLVEEKAKAIKAKPLTPEQEAKILKNAVERKVKSAARAAARKTFFEVHKDELTKALAAAEKKAA